MGRSLCASSLGAYGIDLEEMGRASWGDWRCSSSVSHGASRIRPCSLQTGRRASAPELRTNVIGDDHQDEIYRNANTQGLVGYGFGKVFLLGSRGGPVG